MHVEINKKQVGIKYGMLAAEILASLSEKLNSNGSASAVVMILWTGIKNYYFIREETPPVTLEEIEDFVETEVEKGGESEVITAAYKAFSESKPIQKLIEKGAEELKKKEQQPITTT